MSETSNYLNNGKTLRSWLLTVDHKRIAILICSRSFFFFVGGAAAVVFRMELLTPKGDLISADTYNKMFTLHGIIMVWFFLVPRCADCVGKFSASADDRCSRSCLSALKSAQLVSFHGRRLVHTGGDHRWRRRYGLDVLHALQQHVCELLCDSGGDRSLHYRFFVDRNGTQFYCHRPYDARTRTDLDPVANFRVVDVCDQRDHGARYAGAGGHLGTDRSGTAFRRRDF